MEKFVHYIIPTVKLYTGNSNGALLQKLATPQNFSTSLCHVQHFPHETFAIYGTSTTADLHTISTKHIVTSL